MKINYDPDSKRVIVAFRGRITVLPGTFETEKDASLAGETHCRTMGWNPQNSRETVQSFRSLF